MGKPLSTTIEEKKQAFCKSCENLVTPQFKLRPDTPHYAQNTCPLCGFNMGWVAKPKNITKRRRNKYASKTLGIDRCQLCQRTVDMLGNNEVIDCHHIVEIDQGGVDDLDNIWWVCTSCHKVIHQRRKYIMVNHVDKFDLKDLKRCCDKYNVPEHSRIALIKYFKSYQEARRNI